MVCPHHVPGMGVHNGGGQAVFQRHGKEGAVDNVTLRQAEGYIGHTQRGMAAQFLPDDLQRTQRFLGSGIVGTDSQAQGIEYDVFFCNAVFRRFCQNAAGDLHAAFCRGGNAALIQRQRHHQTAVLGHQREHGIHALLLAVDGVHHSLAVAAAQGGLHRSRGCRIDLQRQIQNGLQLTDGIRQHGSFVDFRQAYVHIQNVNALLLLGNALLQDIVHIPCPQRLFQTLFSGGIDALTNENGVITEYYRMGIGCGTGDVLRLHRHRREPGCRSGQRGNVGRRSAAAASGQTDTLADHLRHIGSKLFRFHIEYGAAIHASGHTGIGFQQHRHGRTVKIFLHHRCQRLGTKGTVDTDGICPHAFQHGHHGGGGCAGHQLAVLAVGVGHHHRQGAVFLSGQQRRLGFIAIVHGLNKDEIHAVLHAQTHRFRKYRHSVFKVKVTVRLQ